MYLVALFVLVKPINCDAFPYQPKGGYVQCDKFVFGTQCRPYCNDGYDVTKLGVSEVYACNNQKWIPTPKQFDCPCKMYNSNTYLSICNTEHITRSCEIIWTLFLLSNCRVICQNSGIKMYIPQFLVNRSINTSHVIDAFPVCSISIKFEYLPHLVHENLQ